MSNSNKNEDFEIDVTEKEVAKKGKSGRVAKSKARSPEDVFLTEDDVFGSNLSIPPELKKELEDKGLGYKWLNANTVYANHGYDRKGWRVYKSKCATIGSEWKFGSDPEGVIRRGDSILGVKTKDEIAKHKQYLKQKANRLSMKGSDRESAKKLAKGIGFETKIRAGQADD